MNYILDNDGNAVPCADILTWGKWMETADRHVAVTERGDVKISTVFLGLDHSFDGTPVLWETMIFGGEHDQEMDRYASKEDAIKGHAAMVELVTHDLP